MPSEIVDTTAPYELVSVMRASFWVIGPLLARAHEARVSLPGGCAIGTRPVDLFLYGLKELGAEIDIDEGYVVARAPKGGLIGATVRFPKVSVGATHTIMMAATLARGTTIIENAAMEPEITNVAECLVAMGAKISGIGTRTLTIEGVPSLHGATVEVIPDRIETGTFAMAAAMAGGDVLLKGARAEHLQAGARRAGPVRRPHHAGSRRHPRPPQRQRHPGRRCRDRSVPRLPHRPAGAVHGADDHVARASPTSAKPSSRTATCTSPSSPASAPTSRSKGRWRPSPACRALKGAQVMATDLRASVSLVIAGLAARGETIVNRIYHLDRGFERLEDKLSRCGAEIERVAAEPAESRQFRRISENRLVPPLPSCAGEAAHRLWSAAMCLAGFASLGACILRPAPNPIVPQAETRRFASVRRRP